MVGINPEQISREDAIDIIKMWKDPKSKDILMKDGIEEKDIEELQKILKILGKK